MTNITTPPEVLDAYYPEGVLEEENLTGGVINATLLITDRDKRRSILQCLSPIFDETMAEDFNVVSKHLQSQGWDVPSALESIDGDTYVTDYTGKLWRSFTYIESDGAVPTVGLESSVALSGLLGALHNSLSRLDYTPKFSLPHFHESTYYADKLESVLAELPSRRTKALGKRCVQLAKTQSISTDVMQLIHGDPKMTNALYRNGLPFTFIDFDTLMLANPLVDVGDMLRSTIGKLDALDTNLAITSVDPVITAYYDQAQSQLKEAEFKEQARNAGQVISLELCMRYLIDTVEDSYFDWDNEQFESRIAHNTTRARERWRIYELLQT